MTTSEAMEVAMEVDEQPSLLLVEDDLTFLACWQRP